MIAPWTGPAMRSQVDRRAGVEELVLAEPQRLARRGTSMSIGWAASSRSTASALAAATARPIGSSGSSSRRASSEPELAVALGRRPPVEGRRPSLRAAASGAANIVRADVHRADAVGNMVGRRRGRARRPGLAHAAASDGRGRRWPAIVAAMRAARALLGASRTPASASSASWPARPCGSPSVPQTDATMASRRPAPSAVACAARDRGASAPAGSALAPVAEHDVEQDDGRRGVGGGRQIVSLRRRGSIIGCGRPTVYSSSPRSRISWALAGFAAERRP